MRKLLKVLLENKRIRRMSLSARRKFRRKLIKLTLNYVDIIKKKGYDVQYDI